MNTNLKILVAEDHELFRLGLIGLLAKEFPSAIFSQAINGIEVIEKISKEHFDVILLDFRMPLLDGFHVLRLIMAKNLAPDTRILVITSFDGLGFAKEALSFGAKGFCSKDTPIDELKIGIEEMLQGKVFLPQYHDQISVDQLVHYVPIKKEGIEISPIQHKLLIYMSAGCKIENIAHHLGVKVKTVYKYRESLDDVFKTLHRAELLSFCLINDLITLQDLREYSSVFRT